MVMKIASCISGQVNTPIILKSLIEPVLFWAELYKQHYSLETTISYGIFWTLEVRGCAPNSLMIKVQIFCCSKVYIIQAVLWFGCDFLLDYGHIFHAPRSDTAWNLWIPFLKPALRLFIGSFWLICTIRLLVFMNTKPVLYFVIFDLHFTKNPLPGLFTVICFSLMILFRPVAIAL